MGYGKIAPQMYPERIVCLTEETTETLYLLGEQRRIVGISGFTVRPPRARREKPRVSAFTTAKIGKIAALKPDLVLGFSDLQADIAADLIRLGMAVHVFNQRSIAGILQMICVLGGLVGCQSKALALVDRLESELAVIQLAGRQLARRPRVYFEEWDEPQISCIQWVSELVELAGGTDCFPWARIDSLRTRLKRPGGRPTSSSGRGAERNFDRIGWLRAAAGRRCRRCVPANCMRSNPRSFCSRGLRH
jgi:iron complex transport system substrate-binding protein